MSGLRTELSFRRGLGLAGWGRCLRAGLLGMVLWQAAAGASVAVGAGGNAEGAVGRARAREERGDFEAAVLEWESAAGAYVGRKDLNRAAEAYAGWALACRALGFHDLAGGVVRKGLAVCVGVEGGGRAQLEHAGGAVAAGLGRPGAEGMLERALALAESARDARLAGEVLRSLGDAQLARRDWASSAGFYARAAARGESAGDRAGEALALARKARADLRLGDVGFALETAARAERVAGALGMTHVRALAFLTLAGVHRESGVAGGVAAAVRAEARLEEALRTATAAGDVRLRSVALGELGELALAGGRAGRALELSEQAAFEGQRGNLTDVIYRWHWTAARALVRLERRDEALGAYQRAVQAVRAVQNDLILGHSVGQRAGSFRETVGPLFYELADLLLQQAARESDPGRVGKLLAEVRAELESFKSAELDDFFRDHCVNTVRARERAVDQTDPRSAVLYVVPLPDRTELLVGLVDGIRRFPVAVTGPVLMETAQELRRKLEKRTTHQYRVPARRLYQWLIAPVAGLLAERGIETLVVVPDGALRTIPLGALLEGEKFLIERFAVAVSPGLTLLSPEKFAHVPPRFLTCGLTVEVSVTNGLAGAVCAEPRPAGGVGEAREVTRYAGLDHVPAELAAVSGMFGGTVLRDQDFRLPLLRGELEKNPVSVLHVASHGEFGATAQDTFLVTFAGKLTLDDLEALVKPRKYRGQPLELLALSACQTAAGDDRAALGLAGVALKAGARSALATLWSVNDEASALLVTEFYGQIREQPGLSRAQALRRAQVKLIGQEAYYHPALWSAFLLIGNWL